MEAFKNKKILNLGLSKPKILSRDLAVTTLPIIKIEKVSYSVEELYKWQQIALTKDVWIFSSKTAAKIFLEAYPFKIADQIEFLSVGDATTEALQMLGIKKVLQAEIATQEGIFAFIKRNLPKAKSLFWPRSVEAREALRILLEQEGYNLLEMPLYFPKPSFCNHPIDIEVFDAFLFTSPSTVNAYLEIYKTFPSSKTLLCIGPITYQKVSQELKKPCLKDRPEILMLGDI